MSQLDPSNTTIGDLVNAALKLATVVGVGQTASADDANDAWSLCQIRPDKIESAFLRQVNQPPPNQVDFPLQIVQSKEDYNTISLKSLVSFPQYIFFDPQWPLGSVFAWPVPQASVYALYVTVKTPMQYKFANLATKIALPYEYYEAILFNLTLRIRMQYGISNPPGDMLPKLAKNALNSLRLGNTAIKRSQMPGGLRNRGKGYNIFSDRFSG